MGEMPILSGMLFCADCGAKLYQVRHRGWTHEQEQSQTRIRKLDDIIQCLYGDNIKGKISDERFMKMNASYEAEQHTLESRVAELKSLIALERENKKVEVIKDALKYFEVIQSCRRIIRNSGTPIFCPECVNAVLSVTRSARFSHL